MMDIRGKYPLMVTPCPLYVISFSQDVSLQSQRHRQPLYAQRNRSKPYKRPVARPLSFLPSSLPLPVSGMLCSRLAANHPSANPATAPSGLAGGSPLATLIEVVFVEGTLLMGLGSSSPVVDEMTLHAPDLKWCDGGGRA
jgi:hypothetical protein